jgi:hypothetical protein
LAAGAAIGAVLLVYRFFDIGQIIRGLLDLLHLQQSPLQPGQQHRNLLILPFRLLAVGEQFVAFTLQLLQLRFQLGDLLLSLHVVNLQSLLYMENREN